MFARLPPEVLYPAWCDTLRGMANLNRAECLRRLGNFGPVVAALGGRTPWKRMRPRPVDQVGRDGGHEDSEGAGMPDPVTFSTLGGLAASEGINFLYGQAAELLKAWRERRGRVAAGESRPRN